MQDQATVDLHITSRGEPRIKVRYSSKPSQSTLEFLRMNGRFRKGTSGTPPAWYLQCDAPSLRAKAIASECNGLLEALDNRDFEPDHNDVCHHTPPNHSVAGAFCVMPKAPGAATQSATPCKRLCMADKPAFNARQHCAACDWEHHLAAKDAHVIYKEPHTMCGRCWFS
jgi:hypothetical protein